MSLCRALCAWVLCLLASGAMAQVTAPHPRLILDAATLGALRARAASNTPQWQALKAYCDSFIGGAVNYPDEPAYPDPPDIGQGYQGEDYFPALIGEALCYQTLRVSDPATAAKYGAKAADVLVKMSMPFPGTHGEDPSTDSGYAIRFFGVGMGIAYDWLYDVLTPEQRKQVYSTANGWVDYWEGANGPSYLYGHPQGNYFAGYFHAKVAIALATFGDNPKAPAQWLDWQTTQFHTAASNPPHIGVQPYYEQHLAGGGWPEGFGNYGPLATFNMNMPIWEVKTATGEDLIHAAAPFHYPIDSADYVMHFTWPSRDYIDDRDTDRSNGDPSRPPPGTANAQMFMHMLAGLRFWNAPHANVMQQYLNEVSTATSGYGLEAWSSFLFLDPNGAAAPLSTLSLSYFATGMNAVAARSDWTTNASWMSFRAGPFVGNPATEELFDQGGLALVRGKTPLLVNGSGWIVHEPNGNVDENKLLFGASGNNGDSYGKFDANNVYSGNRVINNIFYVRNMNGSALVEPFGQAAFTTEDDNARTGVAAFEDGGSYVYVLATRLEDMYRRFKAGAGVAGWSRQVVYLRPGQFVVYDRTTKGRIDYDQYLAFHFPALPAAASALAGERRFDISYAGRYAGAMTTVLPANAATTTIEMYPPSPTKKVWQVQLRPSDTATSQRWLTVFDLAGSPAAVAQAAPVDIAAGAVLGVLLTSAAGNSVMLSGTGAAGTTVSGDIRYSVPAAATHHVVTELVPASGYAIAVNVANGKHDIAITSGGTHQTSAAGVLDFSIDGNGAIAGSSPVNGICGSDNGQTLVSAPTNLCSAGSPSAVSGTGPWAWSCNGSNGGTNASCSAQNAPLQTWIVTPVAGGAGGSINPSTPQTVSNGGTTSFTIVASAGYAIGSVTGCGGGLNGSSYTTGAITANCSVSASFVPVAARVDGACGGDDGKTLVLPPTNLCSAGKPGAVLGNGPWTWTCSGVNGGSNASCSAQLQKSAGPVATSTALTLVPNPASVGQIVGVTIAVNAAAPTGTGVVAARAGAMAAVSGTVTVSASGASCTAVLSNGSGYCTLTFPYAGTFPVTASYSGDSAFAASNAIVNEVVNAGAVGSPSASVAAPILDLWAVLLTTISLCGFAWRWYARGTSA